MAYTDDWETLMNGVFGPGGRFKAAPGTPAEPRQQPNSTLNDLNAALLEQQKKLDAMLKAQSAQLKTQDTAAEAALANSRQMLRDMENDGLLAKGTTDVKPEQLGSFEGLADEVRQTVLGQDAFVDAVVRAMRRPFVLGTEPPAARNVILLCGGTGTGRHFALEETARCMAARGLLQNDQIAALDLALYANPAAEKLFLQDLYAALHAPGEIVVFEHYESCCSSFLKTLSDLAVRGSAPLSSRYIVNRDGILVDAGTALAPGAVSRLDPCGKYLIFFSNKGRAAMADKFGASMVSALGDVCETTAYQQADLAALAAQQLNALAQKVTARLGLTLAAGADVRDYVAAQCTPQKGAAGLSGCCDRIFRALSEYCLQTDKPLTGTVSLNRALQAALNPPAPDKHQKTWGELIFREGDRVMQTRNNYDVLWQKDDGEMGTGIFNGDVGIIQEIDPGGELVTIRFDDRTSVYTPDLLGQLDMAYAMTVHKAQGSEYRAVVLVSAPAAASLMVRGVLYTAITRARELLVMVGDDVIPGKMAENDRQARRYSGLRRRLMQGGGSDGASG